MAMTEQPLIAVFGGAFDPPHLGHALVVSGVLNSGLVKQVLIVPVGDDRYDRAPKVEGRYRRLMVEAFLRDHFAADERVCLETAQLERKLPESATIDLMLYVKERFPEDQFAFVIGADNLEELPSWRSFDELRELVTFIVIGRPGEDPVIPDGTKTVFLDTAKTGTASVSSSQIRQMISSGSSIAGLVPPSVQQVIEQEELYSG